MEVLAYIAAVLDRLFTHNVQSGSLCGPSHLLHCLAATGQLVSVKVIRNKATQKSEGYGFVEFASHQAAESVMHTYNGQLIPNTDQIFRLNWATFGVGKALAEGG